MKRLCALVAIVLIAAVAGAGPAGAHQEISPSTVPLGKPAFLTLSVANERSVDMNRVVVAPPSGVQLGHAVYEPPGWSATLTHTLGTWTGGAVRPGRFERWGFDIEPVSQPGDVQFRVTLGWVDGSQQEVNVLMTAVAAGTAAETPLTTAAPATTVASEAATTAPATDAAPLATSGSGDGSGRATIALVLSALALLVAIVAAARSRPRSSAAAPTGPAQDW